MEKGEYTFWLVAVNIAAPKGVRSDTDTAIVADVAPPKISYFKATQTTSKEKEVTLNWALGGGQVSKLTLVYIEGEELENFPVPIKDLTKTSHTLTLSKKGKYTFQLVAANDGAPTGVSSDTEEVIVVDVVPPTISNFKATQTGDKRVEFTWELSDGAGAPSRLSLFYNDGSDETEVPIEDLPPKPSHTLTLLDSELVEYTFWLVAVNAAPLAGVSDTEKVTVVKVDPPTIGKLKATQTGEKEVTLNWEFVNWKFNGGDPTKLTLYWTSKTPMRMSVPLDDPTQTSHTITKPESDKSLPELEKGEYTFWLVASNDDTPPSLVIISDTRKVHRR